MNSILENSILKLERIGYRFTIAGDNLKAQYAGSARPPAALVAPHLAAIKADKAKALAFLAGRQNDSALLEHGATYTISGAGSVWLAMYIGGKWTLKDVNKSFSSTETSFDENLERFVPTPYEVVNCLTVANGNRLAAGEYYQAGGRRTWQIEPELTPWTVANLRRCRIKTKTIDLND